MWCCNNAFYVLALCFFLNALSYMVFSIRVRCCVQSWRVETFICCPRRAVVPAVSERSAFLGCSLLRLPAEVVVSCSPVLSSAGSCSVAQLPRWHLISRWLSDHQKMTMTHSQNWSEHTSDRLGGEGPWSVCRMLHLAVLSISDWITRKIAPLKLLISAILNSGALLKQIR